MSGELHGFHRSGSWFWCSDEAESYYWICLREEEKEEGEEVPEDVDSAGAA